MLVSFIKPAKLGLVANFPFSRCFSFLQSLNYRGTLFGFSTISQIVSNRGVGRNRTYINLLLTLLMFYVFRTVHWFIFASQVRLPFIVTTPCVRLSELSPILQPISYGSVGYRQLLLSIPLLRWLFVRNVGLKGIEPLQCDSS